ncbi:MAG TPA: hypothetical protein VFR63_10665 [Gaiellaceae bacterium]|nr:hypothetical protein [Gaiellaceae bacterium]
MPTTTRDPADEIHALEELWEAPPAVQRARRPAKTRRWTLPPVPGRLLAAGWIAFFTLALLLEPAAEPGAAVPAWAVAVFLVELALLLGAAGAGALFSRAGFAAATLAGPLGMALAVECRTAAHHLGSWWLVELGATAALTGLAAVGLVQRLRRQ